MEKVKKLSRWTIKEFKQAVVTQKISYPGSLIAEDIKFLRRFTKKKIKATLPASLPISSIAFGVLGFPRKPTLRERNF